MSKRPTTSPGVPAHTIKGGDYVEIGHHVREVFDTYPCGYNATMVRFLDNEGEVRRVRFYANDRVVRVETLTALRAGGAR